MLIRLLLSLRLLTLLRTLIPRRILTVIRRLFTDVPLPFPTALYSLLPTAMPLSTDIENPTDSDPPPFDPTAPATPISYPITTLEDLESRIYFKSFHYPFNKASVKLPSGDVALPDRRRNLVCHDMQGGYKDDRWVQGGENEGAYAIWHWYLIDVFVYFSHNLVTLPPPCWTNAAHRHGVKVLGTFILEWDEGAAIANKMLSTKESAQLYAERLSELAVALGFDGWLINMEVELDVSRIPILKEFVSHLTQTMHSSLPGALVIWYDSITIDGQLVWQNQLNSSNKPFFDLCDGILVNYSWEEDYPKLSAAVAGSRKLDVYMGIDVFGRNTYGGGQWTTNVALDVLKKDDVSACIFAPGWVYETNQPPDFETAQNRWWGLVEKSWGIAQKYPKALPFYSNFDQGRSYHFSVDGRQVSDSPWNNISNQNFQPFLQFTGDSTTDEIRVSVNFKEASYNGGGNVTFGGTLSDKGYFTTRLFLGELVLGNLPLHFTYSVKSDGSSMLGLSLEFSTMNKKTSVLLASRGNTLVTMNRFSNIFSKVIMPHQVKTVETDLEWVIQESSITMEGYTLTGINVVGYKLNPRVSKLELESEFLNRDNSTFHGSLDYYAVLGHIAARTSAQNSNFPPSSQWLVEGQDIKWNSGSQGVMTVSVKVVWSLKDVNASTFAKYNIYVKTESKGTSEAFPEFLGVAEVQAFYASDFVVPTGSSSITFIVQVCGLDGTSQNIEDSPSLQLPVGGS